MMSVSVSGIQKNRCRTTLAERMGETRAELPFTGDQVGLFRAQPGRPKGRYAAPRSCPDPLHGNNTMFQIRPLTPSRDKRLDLVLRFESEVGQGKDERWLVAGRPALLRSGFAQFGAQPFNVGGNLVP